MDDEKLSVLSRNEGILLMKDTGWRFLSSFNEDVKELRERVLLPASYGERLHCLE